MWSFMSKFFAVSDTSRSGRPATRTSRRLRLKPRLDLLEGRALLSTLTVTSVADSGAGSLRHMIDVAKPGDTIHFSGRLKGATIKLAGSELVVNKSLDIEGPGSDSLTISAGGKSRVFEVDGKGTNVTLGG